MTGRKTLDQMNSDDLDQLHDQLARVEATIGRVRALAARIRQGAPWTANDDDIAAHLLAALDEPAPVAGPAAATPCPACQRADQAGLAPAEQHPACTKEQH